MRRDLNFTKKGCMAVALDLDPARCDEIETQINRIIDARGSLQDVFEFINNRGDLTDAEWTVMAYTVGYFDGRKGR